MNDHDMAILLHEIRQAASHARGLCATSRVIDLLNVISAKSHKLIEGLGLEDHVAELADRRIDPTI